MIKNIHFVTSAPIKYRIGKHNLYDSFNIVSLGESPAFLTKDAKIIIENQKFPFELKSLKMILSAPTGQTYNSAKIIRKIRAPQAKIETTRLLENIKFSFHSLINRKMFETLTYESAMAVARKEFLIKFLNDDLSEKIDDFKSRLDKQISLLKTLKDMEILVVGHSFYLKLLQIYLNQPEAYENITKLSKAFNPNKKPFKPLEGFSIALD